ncbi:MAG: hypothetical protein SFY68_13065 [Candidatus Sumerlaeia bacterium]|nr:hypothetical protein [Candidatus Sumerlaeia bacterium]
MKTTLRTSLALSALLLVSPLAADEVIFKSGLTSKGRVEPVFGSPSKIAFISSSGRIEINRTMISKIVEQTDEVDYTLIGDQFFDAADYEKAIEYYQMAVKAKATHQPALDGLEKARAGIANRREQQVLQQRQENSTQLEDAQKLIAQKSFAAVERMLNDMEGRNPTPEQVQDIKRLRIELYLAWAFERADKLDRAGAENYYNRVLGLDPENPQAREAILALWERNPNKRAEVAAAYEEKLKTAPQDLTLNQKLADLYLAMNQPEKALGPLKRMADSPLFQARGYDKKLLDAFVEVSFQQSSIGQIDEAIATLTEMKTFFPRVDDSQLKLLEYRRAANALAPEDFDARAELITKLEAQGMQSTAVFEAERLLRENPGNEKALRIFRTYAEREFTEIENVFKEGQFLLAANMSTLYADKYANRFPDLVQQAGDLYNKAQLEAAKAQKQKREQAREVVNLADQYFAEARRNTELYKSADNPNRSSVISYKNEAIRYTERAISGYKTALQIDPSLGPLVGGMDVNSKLEEADRLLNNLTRDPIRVFQKRSSSRNRD